MSDIVNWDLPLLSFSFHFACLVERSSIKVLLYHFTLWHFEYLGTEDTKWWSVFRCNFVPFFLQTSLKVGNSTGSSLSHFALQNAPHILYWRQVGTAGRPVKYPYPLPPQPGLCKCVQNVVLHCLVEIMHGRPLEKMSSWRQHIVLQNLYVLFSIMVPSQKCKLPLPRALTQPHTMTDPGFWTCCW